MADSSKVTIQHGYGDARLQRLSKRDGNRVVLDTYLAMIELRLAGYDAVEFEGDLYITTTRPTFDRWIDSKRRARVYGPNNCVTLLDRADTDPDAKLAPKVVTERATKLYQTCPQCGNDTLEIDGEFSVGVTLPTGYTPAPGELVKNHYMECSSEACGFEQAS